MFSYQDEVTLNCPKRRQEPGFVRDFLLGGSEVGDFTFKRTTTFLSSTKQNAKKLQLGRFSVVQGFVDSV